MAGLREFFTTLSGPPERAWPDGAQHHGARILLLLSLSFVTYLFFPVAVVPDFPQLERGMVVDEDIIAEIPFQVSKPESELQRERESAAGAVAPIFRYDSLAVDTMRARIERFLGRADSAFGTGLGDAEAAQHLRTTLTAYSLPVADDVIDLLRPRMNRNALRRALTMTVNSDMRVGVAASTDLEQNPSPQVRIVRNGTDQLVAGDQIMTGQRLRELAIRNLPMDAPAGLGEFQRLVLLSLFVPTLRYDRAGTESVREGARRAVPTVEEEFVAGERVIFSHERLQDDDVERLRAYQTALSEAGRLEPERNRWLRVVGMLLLNLLVLLIIGFLLFLYRRQVYESLRAVLLLSFLFLTVVAAAAVLGGAQAPAVLVPIALPALVTAVLWDGRLALTFALVIAILITMQAPYGELSPRILLIAGGAAAALSVRVVRRRAHGLILGVVVALAYSGVALAVGLLLSWEPSVIGTGALLGSANGIACALIAMGLMPVFEAWTGITTDQTLLELSDLNGPLLKRLSLEASGTYAHSINVANLAEAAARAIDANPLLTRVGAYYHDIGKMAAPQFFVENQPRGRNPHDRLDPETSASIVRNHVIEGMKMADQAKLPTIVKRFIPEHHGTQIIGFFHEEAKRLNGSGEDLDIADFSYPGPLPRSKETAILMLADSVESATKVLDEPTPEKIRELVDRIVGAKLERGQLDEAPITLQDLARIKQQFVVVLSGMYHHRLDYPSTVGIGRESAPASKPGP
jgi:putative nucleotidyltransferase with HDIG domain